jgi:integrase
MPLNRIRRSQVQAWVKELSARLQPGTVRTRFHNVRTVLRAARTDRVISDDPTAGIRLPTQGAASAMRLPTPDEVGAILAAASPQQQVFISVCAFGGLRLGEAAALRGSDFNLPRRRLSVLRQVQRAIGHKSATTTLRTYAHLWPSAEDKTRSAASALMQQALGTGVRAALA